MKRRTVEARHGDHMDCNDMGEMRNVPLETMAMIVDDLDGVAIECLKNTHRYSHLTIAIETDCLPGCKKLLLMIRLEENIKMAVCMIACIFCKVKHHRDFLTVV